MHKEDASNAINIRQNAQATLLPGRHKSTSKMFIVNGRIHLELISLNICSTQQPYNAEASNHKPSLKMVFPKKKSLDDTSGTESEDEKTKSISKSLKLVLSNGKIIRYETKHFHQCRNSEKCRGYFLLQHSVMFTDGIGKMVN